MILRNPYLAEETDGTGATSAPSFDKEEMLAFIKEGTKTALKEAIETAPRPESRVESRVQEPENPFAQWVNPLVEPRLAQNELRALAAEDKADFYASEDWLDEVDEHLVSDPDDIPARKKERATIRAEVEKVFANQLQAGRATVRRDILSFVLGEKHKKDKVAYQESIGKRSAKQQEAALEKARRGVDIGSGAISNFVAADVHAMPTEKMLEQYGGVGF